MNPDSIISQWARLGALFNTEPAEQTPDIETLLIETAGLAPEMPRLFTVCVTWLTCYYRLVCRHRLAKFAAEMTENETSAVIGLMLSLAKEHTIADHFNLVIKQCQPTALPKPLFVLDRESAGLAKLAESRSCKIGKRWGLWCENVQLKDDAVRPLSWLMDNNPSIQYRALFGGNLRASILETLAFNPDAGQSESALARHCFATRKAIREALDHLEFCQLVARIHDTGTVRIILANKNLKKSA